MRWRWRGKVGVGDRIGRGVIARRFAALQKIALAPDNFNNCTRKAVTSLKNREAPT